MGRLIGQVGGCSSHERREGVTLAKKYCFSCAHWNPEGANFYENCGAKLDHIPVKGDMAFSPMTVVTSKWKIFAALLSFTLW